jgi:ADP-heptose:LPS heptosyltransferase
MKPMNQHLVRTARRIDFVWRFAAPLIVSRQSNRDNSPKSILVVDLHLIGDMVLLIPLLESLRRENPEAHITLLAGPWAANIVLPQNVVDEHVPFVARWVKPQGRISALASTARLIRCLRRRRWDWAIDIRGDIRQILLMTLAGAKRRIGFTFTGGEALLTDVVADDGRFTHLADHLRRIALHLGCWRAGEDYIPRLRLVADEKAIADGIAPFIGFHFGASASLRRLPVEEAASLINSFAGAEERLVVFEAEELRDYVEDLKASLLPRVKERLDTWRGGLRELIVMMSRARHVYAMDSGPAHIAAALGVPTTVFFGPSKPEYTAPVGDNVEIAETLGMMCRPCDHHHCTNATFHACMRGLVRAVRSDVAELARPVGKTVTGIHRTCPRNRQ